MLSLAGPGVGYAEDRSADPLAMASRLSVLALSIALHGCARSGRTCSALWRTWSSGGAVGAKSYGPVTSNCSTGVVRSLSSASSWIFAVLTLTSAVCRSDSVLDALKRQTIEIDLRDVAGLEPIAADGEHLVVVGEVGLRERQKGLRLQQLDERAAQRERQRPHEIGLRGRRDRGGADRALSAERRVCGRAPTGIRSTRSSQVLEVADVAVLGNAGDVPLHCRDTDRSGFGRSTPSPRRRATRRS